MDVPTLMYNLKEEVTCSVCKQLYTNPKQLPCLHIFCLQCLNNLARTSARYGKIKCPLCKREVAVPGSGTLETLPNCFHMKNLLDILAIKECNNAKVTCENCERKSEEAAYCFHCGKFWCNECMNAHNVFRENRDHRVLALKDFEDKDFEDVLKRPVFCQKELHDKEVLKFYCKECDIPVCQTCVIVDHNKHDVEHLEYAAREVKKSTTSTLDAARESSKPIGHCLRELERMSCLLEHRSKMNKERIERTVHSLMLPLRQKEKESILEVKSQTMKAQQQIRETKDKLRDQLDKRNYSISKIQTLVQRSPAVELVRAKTIINEMCQGLQQPGDIQSTAVVKDTSTVFFENEDISKIISELRIGHFDEVETETELKECSLEKSEEGRVGWKSQFEIITRNSNREQYYCPADVITVDIISKQWGTSAWTVQITDKKNGRYIISYIPEKAGQHLLNVQVNGETLVGELPTLEVKGRFIEKGTIEGRKVTSRREPTVYIVRTKRKKCVHCGKLRCNDCVNAHNIFRENRDHRVLALKDFTDKDFEDVLKRPVLCQKELHDKEVLKFYCKECDIPVCQTCVIVDHNKHDVEHLEYAAREVKKSTTSTLDAARESSKPIGHCLRELERMSCLLEHRSKMNKERIERTVHSLMLSLRQKENESILEVESQTRKAQEQIRKMKDELQEQLDKRNHSISQIETLVQRSPAAELVRAKTIINEMCQGLQQPQDMQSTAVVKTTSTVFFENEDISKIISELRIGHFDEVETETELKECSLEKSEEGRVGWKSQFEIITRNSNREQYYCPADVITVDIISKQWGTSAWTVQITDKKNGRYIISYIPEKAGQHLLNVQVNGETFVGELPTLEVKGRFIGKGTIEGINGPL